MKNYGNYCEALFINFSMDSIKIKLIDMNKIFNLLFIIYYTQNLKDTTLV
jgi:hypothetical protein